MEDLEATKEKHGGGAEMFKHLQVSWIELLVHFLKFSLKRVLGKGAEGSHFLCQKHRNGL